MALYLVPNSAFSATIPANVTTGTAIKTMLQLRSNTRQIRIVEWGISFDASAAATPIRASLVVTGTVFATVTAHVDAGIGRYNPASESALPSAAGITYTTTGTGFTATAEGTITASRVFDRQNIPPTGQYVKQFPLGREPVVGIGESCRIRVLAGAAVGAACYALIEV